MAYLSFLLVPVFLAGYLMKINLLKGAALAGFAAVQTASILIASKLDS